MFGLSIVTAKNWFEPSSSPPFGHTCRFKFNPQVPRLSTQSIFSFLNPARIPILGWPNPLHKDKKKPPPLPAPEIPPPALILPPPAPILLSPPARPQTHSHPTRPHTHTTVPLNHWHNITQVQHSQHHFVNQTTLPTLPTQPKYTLPPLPSTQAPSLSVIPTLRPLPSTPMPTILVSSFPLSSPFKLLRTSTAGDFNLFSSFTGQLF